MLRGLGDGVLPLFMKLSSRATPVAGSVLSGTVIGVLAMVHSLRAISDTGRDSVIRGLLLPLGGGPLHWKQGRGDRAQFVQGLSEQSDHS